MIAVAAVMAGAGVIAVVAVAGRWRRQRLVGAVGSVRCGVGWSHRLVMAADRAMCRLRVVTVPDACAVSGVVVRTMPIVPVLTVPVLTVAVLTVVGVRVVARAMRTATAAASPPVRV